jgi:hypothetical protein
MFAKLGRGITWATCKIITSPSQGFASSMPSSKARYEHFLINNISAISSLESSIRSLTWFLPGRFKDADLVSETRQSLLSLLLFLTADLYIASVRVAQCDQLVS